MIRNAIFVAAMLMSTSAIACVTSDEVMSELSGDPEFLAVEVFSSRGSTEVLRNAFSRKTGESVWNLRELDEFALAAVRVDDENTAYMLFPFMNGCFSTFNVQLEKSEFGVLLEMAKNKE